MTVIKHILEAFAVGGLGMVISDASEFGLSANTTALLVAVAIFLRQEIVERENNS